MAEPVPSAATSPAQSVSASRMLAPSSFVVAAVSVYLASFASQMLLAPPVTTRFNVVPFALVQAVLIVIWIKLHLWRLRDAGRPGSLAYGIAVIYAIEMVLLVGVIGLMVVDNPGTADSAGPDSGILNLFVVLYFLTLLSGDPSGGLVRVWIAGFLILLLLPVVIALVFTGWAATRPRASGAVPAP